MQAHCRALARLLIGRLQLCCCTLIGWPTQSNFLPSLSLAQHVFLAFKVQKFFVENFRYLYDNIADILSFLQHIFIRFSVTSFLHFCAFKAIFCSFSRLFPAVFRIYLVWRLIICRIGARESHLQFYVLISWLIAWSRCCGCKCSN